MRTRSTVRSLAAILVGLVLALGMAPHARAAADFKAVVLNIGADQSQRNVVWYSTSGAPQSVKVTTGGDARVVASTRSGASNDTGWNYHQATLTGLAPNTTYSYTVGSDADGWSAPSTFTTGGDSSFDVLLFGDPQMGSGGGVPSDAAAWASTLALATGTVPGADFLMTLGDQVNTAGSETEYAQFLAPAELRTFPLATNIGNHDNGSTSYGQHFFMPNTDPVAGAVADRPGLGNYWFVQNGVLFLSFNSNNRDDATHFAWAERVVAANPDAKWRVASFHHGPYSTASHADDSDIILRRATWPPVMTKLDIDLVFGGHDHVYSRSHLLNRGWAVGDTTAPAELAKFPGEVLWFTLNSASGSKYYNEMAMKFPFNAVSRQAYKTSFTHLAVTDDSLRVVTHESDGAISDDVTLKRAPVGATPNPVPPGDPVVDFWGDGSNPALGDSPVPNVTDPATGVTTVQARILRGDDDVEEYVSDGEMYLDSSDLEIVEEKPTSTTDKEAQTIGLRFDRVQIPAGARVTSAYIQFTVDEPKKSVGPASASIAIEDTDHAAPYTKEYRSVTNRTYVGAQVAWNDIPEWPTAQVAGPEQRTPDLTSLVQAVVDRDDWFRNNALSFAISGSGARTAEAYEGAKKDPAEMPTLFVTYTMPEGTTEVVQQVTDANDDVEQYLVSGLMDHGSSDLEITQEKQNQLIGLRYPNLQVPAGATIEQAFIQFTTDEPKKSADPFLVRVYGEDVDSSAPFGTEAFDLSRRAKTALGVEWGAGVPLWAIEQEQGRWQRTTDVAAAVQAVVDRDGWAAGNALTLLVEGQGNRTAEAFEGGGAAESPTLYLVYSVPTMVDITFTQLDKHEFIVDATGLPEGSVVTLTVLDKNGKTRVVNVPAGGTTVVRANNWVTVEAVATVGDKVVGTGTATSPHRELKEKLR